MSLKKNVSIKCSDVSKKGDGTSTLEESGRFYGTGSIWVKSKSRKIGLAKFGKNRQCGGNDERVGPWGRDRCLGGTSWWSSWTNFFFFWSLICTYVVHITTIYLFIYLWLCWVFVSVGGLSPVAARGTTLHHGAWASHYRGLSCCGAQAPDAQAQ